MLDTKALAEATAAIVKQHVEAATAPLIARNVELEERIAMLEARQPERGDKGADGEPGKDGIDGKDADPEFVKQLVHEAVAALPVPKDGRDGADGKNGRDGLDGEKGVDGAGIADLVIDRTGALVATFTDGRMKELGLVVGKDGRDGSPGADGKDGRDGMGPEDIGLTLMEDGRTLRFSFDKGDTEYAFQIPFPVMIYRGVWQEGRAYEEGDTVTWGGSLWCAKASTTGKPDGGDFTLCAKKGRDGKDAK
jgi:integrin beta 3